MTADPVWTATEALLRRVLPEASADSTLGDLSEDFQRCIAERGTFRARLWLLRQCLSLTFAYKASPHFSGGATVGSRIREWFGGSRRDAVAAARFLAKRKTTSVISVLTLTIAIAVCTLVLGALDESLFRPVAVAAKGELITLYNARNAAPSFQTLSYPDLSMIRQALGDTADVAAFVRVFDTISGGTAPRRLQGELVSANYFDVLNATTLIGRMPAGASTDIESAIVISEELWRTEFGGRLDIIGEEVRLGRTSYRIAAVTQKGFHGPAFQSRFWLPLAAAPVVFDDATILSRPDARILQTVALLHNGITRNELAARIQAIPTSASTSTANATSDPWRLTAFPAEYLRVWPAYRTAVERSLGMLVVLGATILLVACANLAALRLGRATERQREMVVRRALGASRAQLMRRAGAETVVIVVLAATMASVLTAWGATLLANIPLPVPVTVGVSLNWRLAVTGAAVSGAAFFLLIALSVFAGALPSGKGSIASSTARFTARTRASQVLVVAQVAASTAALIVGGLLLRTAVNVSRVDVGFNPDHDLIGTIALSDQKYTPEAARVFYERLIAELAAIPEVDAVALEQSPPLLPLRVVGKFVIDGTTFSSRYNVVSDGYFAALQIPVRLGRPFSGADNASGQRVAIVNETLAATLGGNPIGRTVSVSGRPEQIEVIGVARDVQYNGIVEPRQPFVYLPLSQVPAVLNDDLHVHLRTRSTMADRLLRDAVRQLDSSVAVTDVHTMNQQLETARAPQHASAMAGISAAGLVGLLAVIGLYGVLAASVDQSMREIAIRTTLGEPRRSIVGRVCRHGGALTAAGIASGWLAFAWVNPMIRALLFQVQAYDLTVFVTTTVAVVVVAGIVIAGPASRAGRVDPTRLLRED
jgi:predicted permease